MLFLLARAHALSSVWRKTGSRRIEHCALRATPRRTKASTPSRVSLTSYPYIPWSFPLVNIWNVNKDVPQGAFQQRVRAEVTSNNSWGFSLLVPRLTKETHYIIIYCLLQMFCALKRLVNSKENIEPIFLLLFTCGISVRRIELQIQCALPHWYIFIMEYKFWNLSIPISFIISRDRYFNGYDCFTDGNSFLLSST